MKFLFKIFLPFLFLALVSCQQEPLPADSLAYEGLEDEYMQEPLRQKELDQDQEKPEPDQAELERKLIKEGHVEFETEEVEETRERVLKAVQKYQAYVSSDQSYTYSHRISHTLVIRVPAKDFDALLAAISQGVEHFEQKNISVKDVTAEFLDIAARLKTKKELEGRYMKLLQKANSVSEMLEIERQMAVLRGDIESIEGRLNYLENQVGLSTLHLTFYKSVSQETAFGKKFREGFQNGWDNLIWFFVGLVNIWPFLLLIPLLIWGIRRIRKR